MDTIAMFDMGDHMQLHLPQPGACGGCNVAHAIFINRGGRTFCVACDKKRQAQQQARAYALMQSLFPKCRCPRPAPDDLFKCICEASEPALFCGKQINDRGDVCNLVDGHAGDCSR